MDSLFPFIETKKVEVNGILVVSEEPILKDIVKILLSAGQSVYL